MRPVLRGGLRLWLLLLLCLSTAPLHASLAGTVQPLRIASFNIQVFGQSKMNKPEVVPVLLRILERYDLVFVMEIRDLSNAAIYDLLAQLNSRSDRKFDIAVSERLGRSDSKEQYAYIYDTAKVDLLAVSVYKDQGNQFDREPYMARLRSGGREFTMIGIHVTPIAVERELRALGDVYETARNLYASNDIYIVGDLNADCNYYDEAKGFDFFSEPARLLTSNEVDTTVAQTDCTYDRAFAFGNLAQASSPALAFDYGAAYGLSPAVARDVSDHYPLEWTLAAAGPYPTDEESSCGLMPYLTGGGYCYASLAASLKRVPSQCCRSQRLRPEPAL